MQPLLRRPLLWRVTIKRYFKGYTPLSLTILLANFAFLVDAGSFTSAAWDWTSNLYRAAALISAVFILDGWISQKRNLELFGVWLAAGILINELIIVMIDPVYGWSVRLAYALFLSALLNTTIAEWVRLKKAIAIGM